MFWVSMIIVVVCCFITGLENSVVLLKMSVIPGVIVSNIALIHGVFKMKRIGNLSKFKKHVAVGHCNNVPSNINPFYKEWWGISGVYKITFLSFRLFTYYGSSKNLG